MTTVPPTSAQHTPGPWYLHASPDTSDLFVCAKGIDDNIAVIPLSARHHYQDESNARLIAAAPELLEHLQNVLDEYQEHAEDMYTQSKTVSSARAAIANAAGRDDSGLFLSAITPLFP